MTQMIKEAWEDSGKACRYLRPHDDQCEPAEICCPNRVPRLARMAKMNARSGYGRRPGRFGRKPSGP